MADNYTTVIQQLAGKVETTRGTAETLTSSHVTLRVLKDFTYSPEYGRFTNEEIGEDIGAQADIISGKKGNISFGTSLKTSGVVGTIPAIGVYLQACGCKEQIVRSITIGSITGGDTYFKEGEAYSAATGSKTGWIARDISAAGILHYIVGTGSALAAADVVTAAGDSATTSGSDALYAVKYSPLSTAQKSATIQRGIRNSNGTSAQDLLEKLAGCMGNCTISVSALQQLQAKFAFQGVYSSRGAGSLLTGMTYEASTAPLFSNATIQVNAVAIRPASFEMDFGNNVEMDPDPSTGGTTNGYDHARITSRSPTIKVDPIQQLVGVLDEQGLFTAGTEFPFSLILGTSPNLIEFAVKRCQVVEWSPGERVGLQTASMGLRVCRSQTLADTDWAIYFR
jgi:hypothetical protein